MDDCIFCKIVIGEIPSEKIYEDNETLAFLDIKPLNHGHTLVIPKRHSRNIFDIPEDIWMSVMKTVRTIAPIVKAGTGAGGINIKMNNEPAAGQDVFHAHVHLIPRMANDGHGLWIHKKYEEGEMNAIAEKIKSANPQ